ncbi:MAG: tRNA pseudouridine(13) synthase TruD, partial [Caldilineaceae bacterium]|nr:tRNA pseudouridine(13) synthase TruD [Caldilineaceae bacterium]
KLKTGHLLGNRFHITVTDSPLEPTQMLANAQAIVQRLRADGAPNFFGVQRFGDRGHNIERGYALLTGQQRIKDRWLRRFLVSSYQSYLCNCYLARRLEMVGFAHLLLGDV